MRRRWDNSIQSANTPTYDKIGVPRSDYMLYRCMITKVLYADDPNNISKNAQNPEVLYEVIILGGFDSGQTLSNCRLASWLGGNNNYSERTLTPTSKDVSKVKLSQHDGDIVYVEFIQGHDAYPCIIALGKGLSNKIAAKKADGPRLLEEFNGLVRNINKNGELITTMKGGSVANERFTPGTSSVISESWLKDEKIVKTFKSGLTITEDGKNDKVEIKTAGGVVATIDGKGNKVNLKAGSTEVIIDGASGKITLKGDFVDLGAQVADFVTQFTQLAAAFATHTHPFIDFTPIPVPSMTQPPAAPLLTSVGSQTVKVQP